MRPALVAALASCVDKPRKAKVRHFLVGLSCDEMQFIAEYLGSRILEAAQPVDGSPAQLAPSRSGYSSARMEDREHKMILLREFLCRSGVEQVLLPPINAGQRR